MSFGHRLNRISHNYVIYILTHDQMISGNVLFYPMGLGLPSKFKKWKG